MPRRCVSAPATLLVILLLLVGGSSPVTGQDVSGLAAEGWAALQAERYGAALDAFVQASELAPGEPTLWFGRGYAAYALGRDREAEAALLRAVEQQPRLTDASRLLGVLYQRSGRVAEAVAVYEAALVHAPGDADLTRRLAEWRTDDRIQSRSARARGTHFRVLFEGPSDDVLARRVIAMLESAYRRVGGVLRTYPSETVTAVLYTQQQFQDVTRAPSWSAGAYDGLIRLPVRGALEQRQELERILTHEFVHVLVAGLGGRVVPTWVNEGLATALEPGGVPRASALLARVSSRPSLTQLHGPFGGRNVGLLYAHSALAVDKLLSLRGAHSLVLLLEDLGRGVAFESAFRHRIGLRYDEFDRMATRLR